MAKKFLSTALAVLVLTSAAALTAAPAWAATAPASHARTLIHYDLAAGQQPENVLVQPDGTLIVALSKAGQIEQVDRKGHRRLIATLPKPADGGVNSPVLGFSMVAGLVQTPDGTLYVNYIAGDATLTGIWRIRPGGLPQRIAAMPAGSFLNGLALDRRTDELYSADSSLGVIWRVPLRGGTPIRWASGTDLQPTAILGANGLKVHNGAVWTDNSDAGTLLRIPIGRDGKAGATETRATGLGFVDDFVFPGRSDRLIAAVDVQNEVLVVNPDGSSTPILTAADGLEGPTSVALDRGRIYVMSAAFVSNQDPDIVVADFDAGLLRSGGH
jgi:hypothetical protein